MIYLLRWWRPTKRAPVLSIATIILLVLSLSLLPLLCLKSVTNIALFQQAPPHAGIFLNGFFVLLKAFWAKDVVLEHFCFGQAEINFEYCHPLWRDRKFNPYLMAKIIIILCEVLNDIVPRTRHFIDSGLLVGYFAIHIWITQVLDVTQFWAFRPGRSKNKTLGLDNMSNNWKWD